MNSTKRIQPRGEKKCKTCQGYGMWAIGIYSSMGEMDAASGYHTLPCLECKANANPIKDK